MHGGGLQQHGVIQFEGEFGVGGDEDILVCERVGEGNALGRATVFLLFNESVVSRSKQGVNSAGLALGHRRATCT